MITQKRGGRIIRTIDKFRGMRPAAAPGSVKPYIFRKLDNTAAMPEGYLGPIGDKSVLSEMPDTFYDPILDNIALALFYPGYAMSGTAISVTGIADNGSGYCRCTATAHPLSVGDFVLMCDSESVRAYNTIHKVTAKPSANTFDTDVAYSANETMNAYLVSGRSPSDNPMAIIASTTNPTYAQCSCLASVSDMANGIFNCALDIGTGENFGWYAANNIIRMVAAIRDGSTLDLPHWLGYIKWTAFPDLTNEKVEFDEFRFEDSALARPTAGVAAGNGVIDQATNDANSTATNIRSPDGSAFTSLNTEYDKGTYIAVNLTDGKAVMVSARVDADDLTTVDLGGGDTWQNDFYYIFPPAGLGANLYLMTSALAASTWAGEVLTFGQTFVYEDGQESLIYEMDGSVTVTSGNILSGSVLLTRPYPPRVRGIRMYCREASDDIWKLLLDIDFERGCRKSVYGEFEPLGSIGTITGVGNASSNAYILTSILAMIWHDPPSVTYESINGYSPTEESIDCPGFMASTISGNRVWLGNLEYEDEGGNYIIDRSQIAMSCRGRYDTFPRSWYTKLTGLISGQSIVAMASFRDHLLIFSDKAIQIHDVSDPNVANWRVIYEGLNLGVPNRGAVTETDYGIAWGNDRGLFLYDGSGIQELFMVEHEGTRYNAMDSTYLGYITDNCVIGYDPIAKHLLLKCDTASDAGRTLVYDLVNKTIWYNDDIKVSGTSDYFMSNFAVAYGKLIFMIGSDDNAAQMKQWNQTAQSCTQDIRSDYDDFEHPGMMKKVYAITINYKLTTLQTLKNTFSIAVDGSDSYSNSQVPTGNIAAASSWDICRVELTSPVDFNTLSVKILGATSLYVGSIMIEVRPYHKEPT